MKKTGRKSSNVRDIRKGGVKWVLHKLDTEKWSKGSPQPAGRNNTAAKKARKKIGAKLGRDKIKGPKPAGTPRSTRKQRRARRK